MKNETSIEPLVLIVEDESTLAMIIKDTLEDEGFRVLIASDGLKGLAAFEANHPKVVIADVMMPQMDGFEMIRRIRRKNDMVSHRSLLYRRFSRRIQTWSQ